MSQPRLYPVACESKDFALTGYADTIICEPGIGNNDSTLIGIRLGGEPAATQALATVLRTGVPFRITVDGNEFTCQGDKHKYSLQYGAAVPYCEALLTIQDEEIEGKEKVRGRESSVSFIKSRVHFLYCAVGDHTSLFRQIQRKTCAPMLPEFQDYVLCEAQRHGILTQLEVYSTTERFEAWRLSLDRDEKTLIEILNCGLKKGDIRIPGTLGGDRNAFKHIATIPQYLNTFGTQIAEKIKSRFTPLFDPAAESLSKEIRQVDTCIWSHTGYHLYDAQMAVAEAVKRKIDRNRPAIIVAECGAGKTKMGTMALAASQLAEGGKHFNIVLCPSHMTAKWVREIEETAPNSRAVVVRDISQFKAVYRDYTLRNTNVYVVISKESARDGYFSYPAVTVGKSMGQTVFRCPDCGAIIEEPLSDGGSTYWVTAQAPFFRHKTTKNHKCLSCGASLWAPLTERTMPEMWTKIGNFGYVYLPQIDLYYDKTNNPAILERLKELSCTQPGDTLPPVVSSRKYPLSTYIRKQMKGRIDALLADELHQYNNDSGQGDAMAEIAGTAKKVVGMTATLINGYATGIFYLLYRLFPHSMQLDGKQYREISAFAKEYGIIESSTELELDVYNDKRPTAVRKRRDRLLPGISPLVYSRFLMESAVFLSLTDIGKHLPEYEEMPIPVKMSPAIEKEYQKGSEYYVKVMRKDPKLGNKIWSSLLNLLSGYPDQPYDAKPIRHPESGEVLFRPQDTATAGTLLEKDLMVLELVRKKIHAGENVLIYTSWTRLDTQKKLLLDLEQEGIPTELMTPSVTPAKREAWLANKAANGMRVLVTNPSLIETGMDLNMFTTLIFYNMNYNPFTLRQASRRSWRINQTALRIEVYFFYYIGTVQERALHLMATKLAAAGIIEGHISDEGLAALSECRDVSAQLAKELAQGVQNHVDDMADIFRRMAMLKTPQDTRPPIPQPASPQISSPAAADSSLACAQDAALPAQPRAVPVPIPQTAAYIPMEPCAPAQTGHFEFGVSRPRSTPNPSAQELGQISLFELSA